MKQQIVKRSEYIAYAKALIANARAIITDIDSDISECLDKKAYAKEIKDKGLARVMKAEIRILKKRKKREERNLKDYQVLLVMVDRKLI